MNESPIFDFTFERAYDVVLADELPGSGRRVTYLPSGSTEGGRDGLLLKFTPVGGPEWLGCFAFGFGRLSQYAFCGVFSTPRPLYACVISRGAAYLINSNDPLDCSPIEFLPILDVKVLPQERLLLFSSYTSLGVIESDGGLWKSTQLCWDDLRIETIKDGVVTGVGSDPTNSATSEGHFTVDLRKRRVLNSAYPEKRKR